MNKQLQQVIYNTILEYPAKSDYELTDILKQKKIHVSRSTVWKARTKFVSALDYQLAQKTAGKFLADFSMAAEYWKKQIDQLEEQKSNPNKVLIMTKEGPQEKEVPKSDAEIREIMRQQNILFLARQGEAVEVMRLMQSGRIPIPDQSRKEAGPAQ
jgi:hypothetical protein